jgi:hypothetical protein
LRRARCRQQLFFSERKVSGFPSFSLSLAHTNSPPLAQVVASLVILYLQSLPHPIVPPKFYVTFMRIGAIPHTAARTAQIRVLLHKLPVICKTTALRLLLWLHATQLPVEKTAPIFAKFFLRPTNEATATTPAAVLRLVMRMIEQAAYLSFAAEEPLLSPDESTKPSPSPLGMGEYRLETVALYDF